MKKYKSREYNSKILNDFFNQNDRDNYYKTLAKMIIAKKIFEGMWKKNMSKKDLAIKMKQQPSAITRWLSGTQNFTVDTLVELQNELQIKLIY